ncbi:hypothetical protein CsatB_016475 [Cannabis sativa]
MAVVSKVAFSFYFRPLQSLKSKVRKILEDRLQIDNYSCLLCGDEVETMEHLFLHCNLASHLWRASPWGLIPINDNGGTMWDWVKFLWSLENIGVVMREAFLFASILVDTIWLVQNEKVHNNCYHNPHHYINSVFQCYVEYPHTLLSKPPAVVNLAWSAPPLDWFKLNCDVAVGNKCMMALKNPLCSSSYRRI